MPPEDTAPLTPSVAAAPAPAIAAPAAPATAPQGAAPAPAPAGTSAPGTSAPFSLRDFAAQREYNAADFPDDASLAEALLSRADEFEKQQQLVGYGQQYVTHAAEFQQWLADKQAAEAKAQAEATAAQKPKWQWEVPKYDPRWEGLTKPDYERGLYVPLFSDSTECLKAAEARNAYQRAYAEHQRRLIENPVEAIRPGLEGWVQEQIQGGVRQALEQYHAYQEAQRLHQANIAQWYELDEKGRPQVDPTTGTEVLSPRGQALSGYLIEAAQLGLQGPARLQFAQRLLAADEAQGLFGTAPPVLPAAPTAPLSLPTPEQVADAKKERFLAGAVQRAAQGNHSPAAVPVDRTHPNPAATLRAGLAASLRQRGLDPSELV